MAEDLDDGEFWLPSQFLTDEEDHHHHHLLMNSIQFGSYGVSGSPLLLSKRPSSPVVVVESAMMMSSTTLKERNNHLLTAPTCQIPHSKQKDRVMMSGSPKSPLCDIGNWSAFSCSNSSSGGGGGGGGSSRGSPICSSLVSSPPSSSTPPLQNVKQEDPLDLLNAAAGQIGRLKLRNEEEEEEEEITTTTKVKNNLPAKKFGLFSNPALIQQQLQDAHQFQQLKQQQQQQLLRQQLSAPLGQQEKVVPPALPPQQQQQSLKQQQPLLRQQLSAPLGQQEKVVPPALLPQQQQQSLKQQQQLLRQQLSAPWGQQGKVVVPPALLPPQQQQQVQTSRRYARPFGMASLSSTRQPLHQQQGSGTSRESCGTGVFIPRRRSIPAAETLKKPAGRPAVLLPAKVIQAPNLSFNAMGGDTGVLTSNEHAKCSSSNQQTRTASDAVILSGPQHHHPQKVANHEICLPKEWTY